MPERRGLYDSYSELINIRLQNPDLFAQDAAYKLNFAGWTLGRSFISSAGGKELYLLINPQVDKELEMKVSFASANASDYYIASKSYGTEPTFNVAAGTVTIPSNSYVLILNNAVVNGVDEIAADGVDAEPVADEWFDLAGVKVTNPKAGIYVRVVTYADGTRRSFKQVVR